MVNELLWNNIENDRASVGLISGMPMDHEVQPLPQQMVNSVCQFESATAQTESEITHFVGSKSTITNGKFLDENLLGLIFNHRVS